MKIKTVKFLKAIPDHTHEPRPIRPTFLFIGRSNVGKSSLINMLLERKNLARVSSTPGKTQMIHYFMVNDAWYLVDVPGYGWARVSATKRRAWEKNLKNYLQKAEGLCMVFLLLDARHPPQPKDLQLLHELRRHPIPLALLLTKSDKVRKNELENHKKALQEALQADWDGCPPIFISSSRHHIGREALLSYMQHSLPTVA